MLGMCASCSLRAVKMRLWTLANGGQFLERLEANFRWTRTALGRWIRGGCGLANIVTSENEFWSVYG
jgi:hypothetical protein